MTESNKKPLSEEKRNSDFIDIDESGKVKITDEKVAEIADELNPEELEDIAGGCNGNCGCSDNLL